ncbi:MAG: IS4 family transposase [Patescibacteria group bacterium]
MGTGEMRTRRKAAPRLSPERVHDFIRELLGDDVHATRVLSFASGVVGVIHAAALGIHVIGRGLADAMGLAPKHAIKQIDRLLSNSNVTVWAWFQQWVTFVVAARQEMVVALDWTEFDKDDHAVIALYLITSHGRATPLIWRTVRKSELKTHRNSHEYDVIQRLHEIVPGSVDITVLADRGFGDQKLFSLLTTLGWGFAIRFRGVIKVSHQGRTMAAGGWVPASGHAKMLPGVEITEDKTPIPAVVVKHQKGMKEPWCIATSRTDLGASGVVKLYARRFTIEETFRDMKDNHFGMGLSASHIGVPARRDRLLLLGAISHALLTLLGAAGESCGLDSKLKANTVKTRTMSLFNQGGCWYRMIPTMRDEWLRPLMEAFGEAVRSHAAFSQIFGTI